MSSDLSAALTSPSAQQLMLVAELQSSHPLDLDEEPAFLYAEEQTALGGARAGSCDCTFFSVLCETAVTVSTISSYSAEPTTEEPFPGKVLTE